MNQVNVREAAILGLGRRHEEKREYARMLINSAMTFSVEGKDGSIEGFCEDLSHTGIRFTTHHTLENGQSVEVDLKTKNIKFKPLKAAVEVCRVDIADDRYRVAGIIREYR